MILSITAAVCKKWNNFGNFGDKLDEFRILIGTFLV